MDLMESKSRVIIASLEYADRAVDLSELSKLCTTIGMEVCLVVVQKRHMPDPGTWFGEGKVSELASQAKTLNADALVVDDELSASQLRNLENKIGLPVLDRTGLILEIFSRNARTRESQLQVEIAKLEYMLPRLTKFWSHLGRQRGGIGQKGEGEKQLEMDRRIIRDRLSLLKEKLARIVKEREEQRKRRSPLQQAALVGYTNAGKSTWLNKLTESDVIAQDKLFATLDTTVRILQPIVRPPILLLDTVGFIERLPTHLVASFRSTLEELHIVDLLIHVADGSNPRFAEQVEVVETLFREMQLEHIPKVLLINKIDECDHPQVPKLLARRKVSEGIYIDFFTGSALDQNTVLDFRKKLIGYFEKTMENWEVYIPFSEGKVIAQMHESTLIINKNYLDQGIFFKIRAPLVTLLSLGLERFRTEGMPTE